MKSEYFARSSRARTLLLAGTAIVGVPLLWSSSADAQSVWGGAGSSTTTTDYNLATNWSNPPAGAPPVATGQAAEFGNTGSASVTVTAGPITPQSWVFDANALNYTITGSAVDFVAGLTNNAAVGQAISIANAMSGTTLTQSGASTLTLSGVNSFTSTSVTAGTLVNSGTLNSAVTNSATFNNSGTVTGTLVNTGTVNLTGGSVSAAVNNNAGNFNVTGTAATGSGFTNSAGATATIGATGNLAVGDGIADNPITNAGSLTVQQGGVLSTAYGTLTNSGTLVIDGTVNLSRGNIVTAITQTAGTTTIGGTVNAARFNINGGSLFITGSGALNGYVRFLDSSGVFDISGTTAGATITGLARLGAVSGTVELGAQTLTISGNTAGNPAFAGVIRGTGGVTIADGAILSMGGVHAYTGATVVQGSGQFELRDSGSIASSSMLDLAGAQTVFFNSVGDIALQSLKGVAGSIVDMGQSLTITNGSTSFAGNLAGLGAVLKVTGGHQTLDGVNSYTGTTTVDGGTLSVNGSIASSSMTTVNAGGTLGGNGIVGDTTINGGTLAPGNSIGTLTVQGSLVLAAASTYLVEVSPTNADRVNVTATATLGGATLRTSYEAGSYLARTYTIVNASGGVSGTFSGLVSSNLPSSVKQSVSYDANNAYLNTEIAFTVPGGLSGNQRAVGNTLTGYFNRTGGIPLAFATLTPTQLTQAAGETAVGSQQTSFDAMNQFMGIISDGSIEGRDANGDAGAVPFTDETMAYAAKRRSSDALAAIYRKAPLVAPAFVPSWSVWAAGFGGAQTTDGNAAAGSSTATSRIYGTAVGADYRLSRDTVAGFALAGGGSNFSVAGGGTGRSDLFQVGAFIRHMMGPAYISAALAYGWQDVTTERAVGADRLQGRFNANTFSGRLESGYRFAMAWMGVTPYAAAQVIAFDLPNYGETAVAGANTFALNYGAQSVAASRSEFGLRSDKSFGIDTGVLTLRGRAAWAHNYNPDRSVGATFQTLPGASFVVNGAAQAREAALTTASAEMKWTNGWAVAAAFDGEFSDRTQSYSGKGVVRFAW